MAMEKNPKNPHRGVINGRDDKQPVNVFSVIASMTRSTSRPLDSNEPYAGVIDFPVRTALKKYQFVLPKNLGCFVSLKPFSIRHEVELGGTGTPAGWLTYPHMDYMGAISPMVHAGGSKLWITFPRTQVNAEVMDRQNFNGLDNFVDILDNVEEVSCGILWQPVAFVIDRFEYHGCLSLTTSIHLGGPAYLSSDVVDNIRQINTYLDHLHQFCSEDIEPPEEEDAIVDSKKENMTLALTVMDEVLPIVSFLQKAATKLEKNSTVDGALQVLERRIRALPSTVNIAHLP
jgi:hypothetical protein